MIHNRIDDPKLNSICLLTCFKPQSFAFFCQTKIMLGRPTVYSFQCRGKKLAFPRKKETFEHFLNISLLFSKCTAHDDPKRDNVAEPKSPLLFVAVVIFLTTEEQKHVKEDVCGCLCVFETRVQTRSSKGAFSELMYCSILTRTDLWTAGSDSSCLQLKHVYILALSKKTIRSHQSVTGRWPLMLVSPPDSIKSIVFKQGNVKIQCILPLHMCKRTSTPPVLDGCSSLMARSSDLCFLSFRRWQRWWWWWWWWCPLSLSWPRIGPEVTSGLSRSYSLKLTSCTPLRGVSEDVDRRMGLTSAIGCMTGRADIINDNNTYCR